LTLTYLKSRKISGLSTDPKPTALPARWLGAKLHELDTGKIYLFDGSQWIYWERTKESKNLFALSTKTSIVQLFGDTFAKTAASSLFLLENLTDKQGGTSLTNNGSISLTRVEEDLPLRGFLVPSLNGTTQFFSLGTEAKIEVGTGSFVSGIWFKTSLKGTAQSLFCYGDIATSEQNWRAGITNTNQLLVEIDDGTNNVFLAEPRDGRFQDGRWHILIIVIDRVTNIGYLLVGDNPSSLELVDTESISAVTGTLNNAGESLFIGARNNGAATQEYFSGQLSNFFLYKDADYNLPALLAVPSMRESALSTSGVISLSTNSSGRLNNDVQLSPSADNHYTTTIIHTDEGYYDLIDLYLTNSDKGIAKIDIDGITVHTADRYSASAVHNVKTITKGIFLSEGYHILKWKINGQNGSSTGFIINANMMELIKRDGKQEGGATSFILLGDEINERSNDGLATLLSDGNTVFNNVFQRSNVDADDGDYNEGYIYLKKGLWKITIIYTKNPDLGKIDLDFNDVEVFDQLDAYNASLVYNNQETKFVRLNDGKTNVRIAINGKNASATDFRFYISSLRGELVSGSGYGNKIEVWGADDDLELVSGTLPVITISTSNRFNHLRNNATDLLNDEIIYRRYFSGGVYRVKYLYNKSLDGGQTDILVDTTVIIDNLDQQGATSQNNEAFAIANITRGFNDIHIKNVLDGGTNDFQFPFTLLQFEKIGSLVQLGDAQDTDNENGNLVLLGRYVARKAESTITFNLADVLSDKYSEFIVKINGKATASLVLQATFNGLGTNYIQKGASSIAGSVTAINITTGSILRLASTSIITGATELEAEFTIKKDADGIWTGGKTHGNGFAVGEEDTSWSHDAATTSKINTIVVSTSTSTWVTGTTIEIYGVKR